MADSLANFGSISRRFWATSSMAGTVAGGLEIWLVLQEEDTILLVYEFLEARLCAVRFIFFRDRKSVV